MPIIYHHIQYPYGDFEKFRKRSHRFILYGLIHVGVTLIIALEIASLSELSTNSYSMLDEITKGNIAQMDKGEIVMIQPAIRHPIKVVFPRPPFKRLSR